jgi:hypothetical protein
MVPLAVGPGVMCPGNLILRQAQDEGKYLNQKTEPHAEPVEA